MPSHLDTRTRSFESLFQNSVDETGVRDIPLCDPPRQHIAYCAGAPKEQEVELIDRAFAELRKLFPGDATTIYWRDMPYVAADDDKPGHVAFFARFATDAPAIQS